MLRHSPLLLLLVACGGSTDSASPEIVDHTDLGQACLGVPEPFGSGQATVQVDADGTAPITVIFSECSSGSVDWIDPTCTASVEGDQLVVTTTVTTSTPNLQQSDCGWIAHDCGTVTLPAGDFTLVYGAGEQTFTVPYDDTVLCAVNP